MFRTEIGPVLFNPAERVFEALVTFTEGRDIVRIPTALRFPIDATPKAVVPALIRQAREKRRNARAPLVSRLSEMSARPA